MKRREFLRSAVALALSAPKPKALGGGQLALLGGKPVRTEPFPSWPIIQENDRRGWMEVLEGKKWCRLDGTFASQFEQAYAKLLGAKYCIATTNGTSALFASLNALGVGPGDEVLVTPYTFVATVNAILLQYALPIFVDIDAETFQMDATKLEAAITPNTACILPVHIGGAPADMDRIMAVAEKHKIPVLEDACQAHLAEWRGKKVGTLGDLGCFSFQASKHLSSGEGGAIVTNDEELAEKCYSFHNNGRRGKGSSSTYVINGSNLRMTEFQARLLLEQMTRLEEQSRRRQENAAYLTRLLAEIPGIAAARQYEGCTRNAYHIYMMRYDKRHFSDLPRDKFIRALRAEGIPCSGGYRPLNKEEFLKNTLSSRGYQRIYPAERLKRYFEENRCPANDKLCQEAVWLPQTVLLGTRRDMEQVAEAIRKIRAHAGDLAKLQY